METLEDRLAPTVTLADPGTQNSYDGDIVNVNLAYTDTGSSPYVSTGMNIPSGLNASIVGSNVVLSGTLSIWAHTSSPYSVTIGISDMNDLMDSASQTFTWNVSESTTNQPTVTLTNPGDQNNFGGDAVNLPLMATDSAGNPLSFSAVNLPPGLSITNNLGMPAISGTIDSNWGTGPYSSSVTITATDSVAGVSASQTFSWTLKQLPEIDDLTLGTDSPATNDMLTAYVEASGAQGDTITFQYVWTVNGNFVQSDTTTNASDSLDLSQPGHGNVGDNIQVTVTPIDGAAAGTAVSTSATVAPVSVMVLYSGDGFQGSQDGQFLLYRDDPTGTLAVDYVLAQSASQVEADPTETNGQATFADGAYYTEVDIPSSAVASNGADEIYTLQIVAGTGASYQAGDLSVETITIHAQARVWIDSVQNAVEGESAGYFRLKRASTAGEMTVSYALDSGSDSAVEGLDFAPLPGSVTFADGQQYADVVIDSTGQYANGYMPGDKTVVIQLIGLDATHTPADPGPLVVLAPATPPPPAPAFTAASYTMYAGEGMPGVNQQTSHPWSWIGAVNATGAVSYSITAGNALGFFQINNTDPNKGWITPARTLPLSADTFNLTVTATNRGGTSTIPVTIRLIPWVYLTGDLEGVKADNGGRDRISLSFVCIASAAELQAPVTVFYEVDWKTTIPGDDLVNPAALVADDTTNASLTFEAGRGIYSIRLTPSQNDLTTLMSTFEVSLESLPTDYVVTADDARLDEYRNFGQPKVTCTIFPRTTLFASDNAIPTRQDAGADGGVNLNDIAQGRIGDCYFLADLAALAKSNPAAIRNMIADLGGGNYRVTFYNLGSRQAQTVDVNMYLIYGVSQAKFQGDYTEADGEKSYEIWPQIFEKAYSNYMGRAAFVNGSTGALGYASTVATMIRLTGRESTETDMQGLDADERETFLTGLVQKLNENKPVAVIDDGSGGCHAYAVTGFDATTNNFAVFNPHGILLIVSRATFIGRFRWAVTQ